MKTCSSNGVPDTVKQNLKHLPNWGDPTTYPHYSWGWAHATTRLSAAGNAKSRVAAPRTCASSIGPKGIKAKDAIRPQFVHAIDLVPDRARCAQDEKPHLH